MMWRVLHGWKPLACGLLPIILVGCMTSGTKSLKDIPEDWPGPDVTREELIQRLGPPQTRAISVRDGRQIETMVWSYARVETSPWLWIPIVNLFALAFGDPVKTDMRTLVVAFDEHGRAITRVWQMAPGTSLVIQPSGISAR